MKNTVVEKLTGVPETLLIPLWARAVESRRPNAIIRDEKSAAMMDVIDYDFSKFNKGWGSQLGVAVRTELLDAAAGDFIDRHPDGVIINLGAGLDTRFATVDNGRISWYDLDMPEVIDIRRHFFNETERYHFIAKSMLDFSWTKDVRVSGRPVLIIAEGLLCYFYEPEVRAIFNEMVARFPGAEVLFEMLTSGLVGKSKHNDTLRKVNGAEFRWGLDNTREMETWNEKIRFVEEWNLFDYHGDRWGVFRFGRKIPLLRRFFSQRIVHLRFEQG